jgi:recombinational DNA repair protein (RecF pathway)
VAAEADPEERLYRLGTATLEALTAGTPVGPLARYFEYWVLRLQGVYPPDVTCTDCGTVACLDDVEVKVRVGRAPRAVARRKVEVQLRGLCDDCG